MPYQIEWYLPNRIMVVHLHGAMTVEELGAMADESVTYIKRGQPPVHAIIDQRELVSYPYNLNTLLSINRGKQAESGFTVMVSESPIARFVVNAFFQLIRMEMRSCTTFEEAMTILARVDPSLPQPA